MVRRVPLALFTLALLFFMNLAFLFHSVRQRYGTLKNIFTEKYYVTSVDSPQPATELNLESLQNRYRNLVYELSVQNSVITFLSEPIINNHNFTYIHNPVKTCASEKVEVLFVTPSHPENFQNREKVRTGSRGIYVKNSNVSARMLFFLGKPILNDSNKDVQLKVDNESLHYGDIVQDGFDDVYKNIRYKAVSMLKWAVHFCANAKYVIRSDDDVRVVPEKLVNVLKKKSSTVKNFIVGHVAIEWAPIRDKNSKYFMPRDEYPHSTWPPFAIGGLLGYPMSAVQLLYQAALRVKPVWLDDVYITSFCAVKVNVSLLRDKDFEFEHRKW